MVKELECDIFIAPIDIILHSANCMNTGLNSRGIAKEIFTRFPDVLRADNETKKGDITKLGTFSIGKIEKKEQLKWGINLYNQFDTSSTIRKTNYEAVAMSLEKVREFLLEKKAEKLVIGIPYKMASDRGGGDWAVVSAIIYSIFEESPFQVLICKKDA